METICRLRNVVILCLLCMISITFYGQEITVGPIYVEDQQFMVDVRHLEWSDFEGILPSRAASTRGGGTTIKWIDRVGNMPDYLKDFYQLYGEKVNEVLEGQTNWLVNPELASGYNSKTDTYYETFRILTGTVDFTFPAGASLNEIGTAAIQAVSDACENTVNEYKCFMIYLTRCLNYDYPQAFWTGNSYSWSSSRGYSYSYNASSGTGTAEYHLDLIFILKKEGFDYRIAEFRDASTIPPAVTEFNTKVTAITDQFKSKSRYEQVAGLNDWLTTHNSYNSDLIATGTAPDIAHSSLSALRESTGPLGPVCEGYARAFKVLCDKLNIPCILAHGEAKSNPSDEGGRHMWNEVGMDDDKWYAVDVTWNDPVKRGADNNQKVSGLECHFWLLLGKYDEVSSGFTFEQSHPNTPMRDNVDQSQWEVLFTSLIADYGYKPGETPSRTESITISSAKQVTYMNDKDLDFTGYPDLKAYVATGYDKSSGTIWLTRVKEVPANTGFLLMGEAATYEIPVKAGGLSAYYQNMFKGTLEATTIQTTEGDNTNYYLSKGDAGVGFYKVQGSVELKPNRAYLSVPTEIPAVGTAGSTETIKVSAAGQVPYYNSQSLDFTSMEAQGVKAYTATGYDYKSGTIWLTRVKQVPAETGILIMAPQGEYPVPTASVASVYANMFKGTLTGTTIQTHETIAGEDYINYYLSKGESGVGFYKVTKEEGVTISANRCYLPIKNKEAAAGTRSAGSGRSQIAFEEADEVIGIPLMRGIGDDNDGTTNLTPALSKGEGEWYTLQGQRVAKPGKGLYIRNGKVVIVR